MPDSGAEHAWEWRPAVICFNYRGFVRLGSDCLGTALPETCDLQPMSSYKMRRGRQAFDLIDAKELAPLQELIDQMAP